MVFSRPSFSLILVGSIGIVACSTLSAQQETTKKVAEPVFRVSKLAGSQESTGDKVLPGKQENETAEPKNLQEPTSNSTVVPDARPIELASLPKVPENSTNREAIKAGTSAPTSKVKATSAPHPLDAAIDIANKGLDHMQSNIMDYTAKLHKRETINGKLGDKEVINIKIRNRRTTPEGEVPFSIYMKFEKPSGREVIWVENQNQGNLLVHEPGFATGFKTFELEPTGWMAMRGNLHPIYEAGLENLVKKLIEKAERDREAGQCEVAYSKGAKINGRTCTMIEVTHQQRREPYEFYYAEVFIDDELQIPVRYSAYNWPVEGQKPQLIEQYTYIDVKLNVGLSDDDFDPSNDDYNFPGK